ncbi:MAG: hypothetical protein ACTHU0_29950 [Kofleriaceae bacterium]
MADHFRVIVKELGFGSNGWKLRAYAEPSGVTFEVVSDVEAKMVPVDAETARALVAMVDAKHAIHRGG